MTTTIATQASKLIANPKTATAMGAARSIFGTIATGANVLTKTIDAADRKVTQLSYKQQKEYRDDITVFNATLRNQTAQRIAAVDAEAAEFRSRSKEHEKFFDAAYDSLDADAYNGDDNPFA